MNEVPPDQDQLDDIDDHYRRTSTLDSSRPSESVRRAVLVHATKLAAERAAKKHSTKIDPTRPSVHQTWWRPAIVGTLAAAALAGLLITPQFLAPRAPPMAAFSPATPAARAPVIERSPDTIADEQPPSAMSAEVQSAAKHRAFARNVVPKAIDGYTRPNENGPPADAPAAMAAQNAPAASSGAKAIAPRSARINSTDSAISAAPSPSPSPSPSPPAPAMRQAGHPGSPTALRRAAEIGDIPGLQTSLDEHVDINARDASGRTALMLATLHGQTAAVDTLLAYGADPNAADARGTTPLQAAVAGDQQAIVAALKRAGAR
jgi:Ankyrin repeats (3 copies)